MDAQQKTLFDRIFAFVAERRASDIILSVGNPPMVNADGTMRPIEQESIMTPELIRALADNILNDEQKAVLASEKQVTLAYDHGDSARFRLAFFMQEGTLSVVGRYIPQSPPEIGSLGLPDAVLRIADMPSGLVLICGPQSSGKSTTMASLVQYMNHHAAKHIVTIEDPVEFLYVDQQSVIEQRQIGRDVISQESALEALHDHKADVICIDKLRLELANEVLQLSTGRLVIASMEAESATDAIERVVNAQNPDKVGIVRREFAKHFAMIVVQRLFPRSGGGLVAAAEIMLPSQSIRNTIRDGNLGQMANMLRMSRNEGMQSMAVAVEELARKGEISQEQAKPFMKK